MEQRDFHLQRGVGKQSQQLRLSSDLRRHQVQNCNAQWTDILMKGAFLVHHENILVFERRAGGEGSGNFYGHGNSR
jgi:hypothetical protein